MDTLECEDQQFSLGTASLSVILLHSSTIERVHSSWVQLEQSPQQQDQLLAYHIEPCSIPKIH